MSKISQHEVDFLKKQGHAVAVYPRKKLVIVDGFKRYALRTREETLAHWHSFEIDQSDAGLPPFNHNLIS